MDPRSARKKNALMLWDCVVNSGAYPQWLAINRIIEFMVGISDGLSVKGMGSLVSDLGGGSIPAQLAHFNATQFDSIVFRMKIRAIRKITYK